MTVGGEPLQMYVQLSMAERNCAQGFGRGYLVGGEQCAVLIYFAAEASSHTEGKKPKHLWKDNINVDLQEI